MLDHLRHATHARCNGHDLTRHGFESRETKRLQFARHEDQIRDGELFVHVVLLAQKQNIVVNSLLDGKPLRARAIWPVADQ